MRGCLIIENKPSQPISAIVPFNQELENQVVDNSRELLTKR